MEKDAYFHLWANSDLTFDGNLTIDGQSISRDKAMISLEFIDPSVSNNQFTMAGNGVVLENTYNTMSVDNGNFYTYEAYGAAVGLVGGDGSPSNKFTMEGGRITDNIAPLGAVFLSQYSGTSVRPSFIMKGGTISGNYTDTGKQTPCQIFINGYRADTDDAWVFWGPGVYGRVNGVIRARPGDNGADPVPFYHMKVAPWDADFSYYNDDGGSKNIIRKGSNAEKIEANTKDQWPNP
jgi:hypothetical protein